MKKILLLWIMILPWLSACSLNYSLSEQDLANYLKENIDYQKSYQFGSLADIQSNLNQLQVKIGRDEHQRVQLSGIVQLNIKSFIKDLDITTHATFAAKPIYNVDEGAIYLTDPDIRFDAITPDKYQSIVRQFLPQVKASLAAYLTTTPVYQLDPDKTKEALIKRFAKGIEVTPGKLELEFNP